MTVNVAKILSHSEDSFLCNLFLVLLLNPHVMTKSSMNKVYYFSNIIMVSLTDNRILFLSSLPMDSKNTINRIVISASLMQDQSSHGSEFVHLSKSAATVTLKSTV